MLGNKSVFVNALAVLSAEAHLDLIHEQAACIIHAARNTSRMRSLSGKKLITAF